MGKRLLGRPRCRCEDNIRMDLVEVGIKSMNQIQLTEARDQWRAFMFHKPRVN